MLSEKLVRKMYNESLSTRKRRIGEVTIDFIDTKTEIELSILKRILQIKEDFNVDV